MRYSPAIEDALIAQIKRTPDREIILDDAAYWKGVNQPWVYVNGVPQRLVHILYEAVIASLPEGAWLASQPGTHPRNINPHFFTPTAAPGVQLTCPNNHVYTPDDWIENVGHRCQACRVAKLIGRDDVATINRKKTVCPEGHQLIKRPNGRRRCLECPRARQKAYRERTKGTT